MTPSTNKQDRAAVKVSEETTPLLPTVDPEPLPESLGPSFHGTNDDQARTRDGENDDEEEAKPLQTAQILWLCYTRVVEPIAFFSIFPYINFMIENVGHVKKEDVGFYSGLIESLFSATQMCVMIFWGRASDRWGRKPILVISLIGIAIATTLFGMSQSLWQMIIMRCFAGVFAGSVVTVRTMLSENSTKHTQARAFSYFAFAGNLGLFLGPLLGAALERPATKYPSVFGKIRFFQDYPYALPGIVVSVVALSAAASTLLFVNETIHVHSDSKTTDDTPEMSIWQLLKHPGVLRVLLIENYVLLQAFTYTAVNPVFLYTPIKLGGFGFTPELIALFTALSGAAQAAWLLLVFPPLHKRVGNGRVLWLCAFAWPFLFAIGPFFNVLLLFGNKTLFWATAPPMIMLGSGVSMAFTAVQLAINDISPSHETLGTLNSIALAMTSGLRAVAPAIATSIYAVGVKYHILWGQLFWLTNVLLALGLLALLPLLPDKAKGRVERRQHGRI